MSRPEPPAFDEPWQAQAFALAVSLAESGLFTWADWTRALSTAIAGIEARGVAMDRATYPEAWLAALESLVAERGAIDALSLGARTEAWRQAYLATPHGRPVTLEPPSGP